MQGSYGTTSDDGFLRSRSIRCPESGRRFWDRFQGNLYSKNGGGKGKMEPSFEGCWQHCWRALPKMGRESEEKGEAVHCWKQLQCLEETSDVAGNDLEEESGLGQVVDDAGSEEILLSSSNQKKAIVLFSTVMVVLVAAAFLSAKKKATKLVVMLHEDVEKPTTTTATFEQQQLSSLHFQEEEEEVVDDGRKREVSSFPSEMSFSFHKNKRDGEGQSGGGGKRSNDSGESMASSASEYSMGSVSYGRFTTYEKIQKKSGRKEAEMVTPVRRSSRIRSHQHSGQ